jgi:hypothetical protein
MGGLQLKIVRLRSRLVLMDKLEIVVLVELRRVQMVHGDLV